LQLLKRRGADNPDEAGKWADAALREVDRLNRLVGELLELAKVGEGKLKLQAGPVEVTQLAREVAAQYEAIAPRVHFEQIGPSKSESGAPAVVLGDADRLRQVLINLVDNAMRATRDQGEVTVSAQPHHGRVRLVVADTGVGIPQDRLSHIFDRFYRVDLSRDRTTGGTGLGLSITAGIVEAHEGVIEVTSEVGRGTTFTIVFPAGLA
jgi:signal transduction histidine kinase